MLAKKLIALNDFSALLLTQKTGMSYIAGLIT